MLDLEAIQKDMGRVIKENKRLNHLKERYIEHTKTVVELSLRCEQLAKDIAAVAKDIDPVPSQASSARGTYTNWDETLHALYEKMRAGVELRRSLIEKLASCTKEQSTYLMNQLRKMPRVEERKDGLEIVIYIR